MKKYIIYIGILVGGILLGYVFFGNAKKIADAHNHEEHAEANDQLWTCSMHPQIQKHESGDCPICGMELISVDASNSGLTKEEFRMTPNAIALANIQTSIVGGNSLEENKIQLSGKIQTNENLVFAQSAHFNGRVEKLFVKTLGEKIQKGQALAEVYSPELISAQQELLTTYASRKSQPKLYEAVRNKFKNWMIPQKELDKVIHQQKVLPRLTIYSHASGIITKLGMQQGGHIMDGMTIIEVTKLDKVWAVFDAYENEIEALKKGQQVVVNVNAFPNKKFSSSISFIEPILNNETRTVKVRAAIENKENLLKPGMFAEATIVNHQEKDPNNKQVSIPKSAVLWTGKRSIVYVKNNEKESVFEMREVNLGQAIGDKYMIAKGLKSGEEIVTNGAFTVDAAAQLQGKKSMMNQGNANTEIPKDEQVSFQAFLQAYFTLKNAFVEDNAIAAETASKAFDTVLKNTFIEEKHASLKNYITAIQKSNTSLQKEETIEKQRMHFIAISENIIEMLSNFQGFQTEIYVQKCPMANNNEGARWLSNSKTIENPYFGEAMLSCGSVIDVIH